MGGGGSRRGEGGGWSWRVEGVGGRLEVGGGALGGTVRGKIDGNMIILFDFSRICNMGDTIRIRSWLKFDYLKMVSRSAECLLML